MNEMRKKDLQDSRLFIFLTVEKILAATSTHATPEQHVHTLPSHVYNLFSRLFCFALTDSIVYKKIFLKKYVAKLYYNYFLKYT